MEKVFFFFFFFGRNFNSIKYKSLSQCLFPSPPPPKKMPLLGDQFGDSERVVTVEWLKHVAYKQMIRVRTPPTVTSNQFVSIHWQTKMTHFVFQPLKQLTRRMNIDTCLNGAIHVNYFTQSESIIISKWSSYSTLKFICVIDSKSLMHGKLNLSLQFPFVL